MGMQQPASSAHWLASWWSTPAGERLLEEQAPALAQAVRRFHGDSLLWLGCHSPSSEIVRRCMVRNRFYAALPGTCPSEDLASFSADPQALPKASVNAVVIHHALECVRDPRQTMREVSRVLVPGGKLVITGFPPLSSWGLQYLLNRPLRVFPSRGQRLRPIGRGRLQDWLAVLGFELEVEQTLWHRRPLPKFTAPEGEPRRWYTGDRSFLLAATKQCSAYLPPPKSARLKDRALAPVAYPKLATWRRVDHDR